jgi:hypothetical protein
MRVSSFFLVFFGVLLFSLTLVSAVNVLVQFNAYNATILQNGSRVNGASSVSGFYAVGFVCKDANCNVTNSKFLNQTYYSGSNAIITFPVNSSTQYYGVYFYKQGYIEWESTLSISSTQCSGSSTPCATTSIYLAKKKDAKANITSFTNTSVKFVGDDINVCGRVNSAINKGGILNYDPVELYNFTKLNTTVGFDIYNRGNGLIVYSMNKSYLLNYSGYVDACFNYTFNNAGNYSLRFRTSLEKESKIISFFPDNRTINVSITTLLICTNGSIANYTSFNFCSGLDVYTNSSFKLCSNNSWILQNNNIFNKTCFGSILEENRFCSGNNAVVNYSQPACSLGECGRSYFTNSTVCINGCLNGSCNPTNCINGQNQTRSCNNGQLGVCARTGFEMRVCSAGNWGGWGSCSAPAVTPLIEICNGLDDDCDGFVDENLTQSTNQEGICSSNTQICSNGNWTNSANNTIPRVETCNNLDDNCNGFVDEGIANITSGSNTGECRQEIKSCIAGNFTVIQTQVNATEEVCDNKDNNCNGQIDEDNVCFVCDDGQIQNYSSVNYCGGLNIFTNSTFQLCSNNTWTAQFTNVFNRTCDSGILEENRSCLGNVLIVNYSLPTCVNGGCGREYYQNNTVCEFGCFNNSCIEQECVDGQMRNPFSVNYCSGAGLFWNILTNSSYEQCFNNAWHNFSYYGLFNQSCPTTIELENQYCSEDEVSLVFNYSAPGCVFGNCIRTYFTNSSVCDYGCNSSIEPNECNPPTDWPTCSVDYLAEYDGTNVFNITDYYFNLPGNYYVYGGANSNSNNFLLSFVGYNRTSPNLFYESWINADNLGFWQIWRTDRFDAALVEGNHTVCCNVESKNCVGENPCEIRSGEYCSSFCIDSQLPTIEFTNTENMSNWNQSTYTWTFDVSDDGCAGINHYNVSLVDLNGTSVVYGNYPFDYLITPGLINNHSYYLYIIAVDNAGNSFEASSGVLYVNLSLINTDVDGDGYNSTIFDGDDCNDNNYLINPGATEICGNGIDEDCSGADLACEPQNCTESWVCDSWSDCEDDEETRTCSDNNQCGTYVFRPIESRDCDSSDDDDEDSSCSLCNGKTITYQSTPSSQIMNTNYTSETIILNKAKKHYQFNWFWLIIIILIVLILLTLWAILKIR